MDLEPSAEQALLRDTVRRFLAERAPLRWVRGRPACGPGTTPEVWAGLAGLGALGLLVPEEHGGTGGTGGTGGMVDVMVVCEELGRALHPAPYRPSAVGAVSVVLAAGGAADHAALLPGLADGSTVGALALLERDRRYAWRAPVTRAVETGGEWAVTGEKVHVAGAPGATLLLVTAAAGGALGVFAVDAAGPGVTIEASPTVDPTHREATVRFDGAPARRLAGGDADGAIATALDRLAAASVADAVGAAARALELAVDYARTREQFGRPIGSFQAVQHLCVSMLRGVELGRAAASYACWAADAAPPAEAHRAAVMAQAFAAETFPSLGGTAIQVFGGVGFTWEHDIHLFHKRLLTAAAAYGTADDHLADLASLALDADVLGTFLHE